MENRIGKKTSKYSLYLLILVMLASIGLEFNSFNREVSALDPYVQRQNAHLDTLAAKWDPNEPYTDDKSTGVNHGRQTSYLVAKMELYERGLSGGFSPTEAGEHVKYMADIGLEKVGTGGANLGPWSWTARPGSGMPGVMHSAMNMGYILNKWGNQIPTTAKDSVIALLSNAVYFDDTEDPYLFNARFNVVAGKMLAGEFLGYSSTLWQTAVADFDEVYRKTMKYGGIEMNSPIYSTYVFPALQLLTDLNHPIYNQKARIILDYKLMLHGHLYLPGGGLGMPKHRERAGGPGKSPDALNTIYYQLFADGPNTSASGSFHMVGAAAAYKPPAVIESIFMDKGNGYKFSAYTHGIQSSRNPYGMYSFDGVTTPTEGKIAPWAAIVAPAGDVMIGLNYGTRITGITASAGLTAKGTDGKFHTLYQYQPAVTTGSLHEEKDTTELMKSNGSIVYIDGNATPDDFYRELYDYERMLYGNTYISIWDPTKYGKESWAVRQAQYTVTHLPLWNQYGGTVQPVSAQGWYVGTMGSTYIAYKPLGTIVENYTDYDSGTGRHFRFLKMAGRSGGITEIATTAQFATVQDYIANLDSRTANNDLNFNDDPATYSVEFDALETGSTQTTRVKLEYRPEKRYVEDGNGLLTEVSHEDFLNHGFIDSPWAKWDKEKNQISVERQGYSTIDFDLDNGTVMEDGVWYSKSKFPNAINLGSGNTDIVTLSFDTTPLGDLIDGVIGYADSATSITGYGDLSSIVRMNTSGYFDAFDGANMYQADAVVPYTANTTYHVEMKVDFNTQTYDVYVTPAGGSQVQLASNYAFRATADDLGQIALKNLSGVEKQFKIENHVVDALENPVISADITVRTNQDVTITINYSPDTVVKEYKLGAAGTWTSYTGPITVSQNVTVYARGMADHLSSDEVSYEVTNIVGNTWYSQSDFPNAIFLGNDNTGTVTVDFDTTPLGDNIDGVTGYADSSTSITHYSDLSAIVRMNSSGYFDAWDGLNIYQADASVPYTANTTYHVQMIIDFNTSTYDVYVTPAGGSQVQLAANYAFRTAATDLAQVSLIHDSSYGTPSQQFKVENHTNNSNYVEPPSISADPTTPTNQDVTVTITYGADSATKLYKIGSAGTWTNYSGPFTVSENGTVYAKGINGDNIESAEVSYAVTNIDKVAPADPVISADPTSPTNQDVTISISYSADSDIKQYKLGSTGTWANYTAPFAVSDNVTVYAKGTDEAGNVSAEVSYAVTNIDKVPPADPVISIDPTTPDAEEVTVTIDYSTDSETREYKLGSTGTWANYTAPFILSENDTIYARGTDEAGNVSVEVSYEVSNIKEVWYSDETFPNAFALGIGNTGIVTVDFQTTPLGNNIDGVIGYADSSTTITHYSDLSTIVRMNSNGNFDAWDGVNMYQADTVVPYTANTTYNVQMVVNFNTSTYDVYITPEGGNQVQLAADYAFRTAATDLGQISLIHDPAFGSPSQQFKVEDHKFIENVWFSKEGISNHFSLGTGNTGIVTVDFETTPFANNTDGIVGYADSSTAITQYSDLSAIVRMNTSGNFDAWDGVNMYQADTVVPYTANTKYNVQMVVNFNTSTYDVFITPEGGNQVQLATDYAFRAPANDLGQVAVKHDTSFGAPSQIKVENHKFVENVWYSKPSLSNHFSLGTGNTGIVTVDFDTTPFDINIDGVTGYADSSTAITQYSDLFAIVRMNNTGTFDAWNGTNMYQADASIAYSANTKYHVQMVVDFNTSTYDVYITPEGGSPIQLAANYAFRTTADDLGQIALRHATGVIPSQFKVENHQTN